LLLTLVIDLPTLFVITVFLAATAVCC